VEDLARRYIGHVWFVPQFAPPKFCHDQNSGSAKSLAILCLYGNFANFCQLLTMTSGLHMLLFIFTLKYSEVISYFVGLIARNINLKSDCKLDCYSRDISF
jgi:hypothetical protein